MGGVSGEERAQEGRGVAAGRGRFAARGSVGQRGGCAARWGGACFRGRRRRSVVMRAHFARAQCQRGLQDCSALAVAPACLLQAGTRRDTAKVNAAPPHGKRRSHRLAHRLATRTTRLSSSQVPNPRTNTAELRNPQRRPRPATNNSKKGQKHPRAYDMLVNWAATASMNGSVVRYESGATLVVPCTQMARSFVYWPASMVAMVAASRLAQ